MTPEKDLFNVYLNKTRVHVEMAYGRLKGRWRVLQKKIDAHLNFVPKIVAACCLLHNIVEINKDTLYLNWLESVKKYEKEYQQPIMTENYELNDEAKKIRTALTECVQRFPLLENTRMEIRTKNIFNVYMHV